MTPDFRALCADIVLAAGACQHDAAAAEGDFLAAIDNACAALDQAEPERHQAIARRSIESCLAQRDEVLAAFIAKHGFHPEDTIQVEQRQSDGTSTWRIERHAALSQTEPVARPEDEIDEQAATLIPWLLEEAIQAADADQSYAAGKLTLAAQLLGELRPTAQPVPASEDHHMTFNISGERRYGVWGGCPQGQAEDPTRCIEEVWPGDSAWIPHQCCRKRGHGPDGLYCKQHAKKHQPTSEKN